MNLFVAWRDSLTLLEPKNFKLFFLVTLKSIVDTLKVWIKYFWWIPVLWIMQIYAQYYLMSTQVSDIPPAIITIAQWLSSLPNGVYLLIPSLNFLLKITLILAARPSTALKNCAYFRSYFWRLLITGVCFNVLQIAYIEGASYIGRFVPDPINNYTYLMVQNIMLSMFGVLISFYFITYALFFFDGDGSVRSFLKSWIYAAQMLIYNMPFYGAYLFFNGLLQIGTVVMYSCGGEYWLMSMMVIAGIFFLLLELFTICFLTNFYIKKIHDQFTLYFGKNA